MAGMIPTPFPSPVIFRSSDGFSEQLENVLKSLDCHCPIITDIDLGDFLEDLDPKLLLRHPQWNISKIKESWDELPKIEKYNLQDIALVQYTSGSTSFPKGVVVGQKEILANIEAIIRSVNVTSNDFNVTWLPLYHDMGLIGGCLTPMCANISNALFSPIDFILNPARWLWTIHHHRPTLSPAPNFAFDYCVKKINGIHQRDLDLSSWRVALCGAEPVKSQTLLDFSRKFSQNGFKVDTFFPVYGLAENVLAVTMPGLTKTFEDLRIDRKALYEDSKIIISDEDILSSGKNNYELFLLVVIILLNPFLGAINDKI